MDPEQKEPDQSYQKLYGTAFKIENSDYYNIYLLEHKAIMDNKYFLTQKLGYEVSYQQSFWNFNFCHRDKWLNSMRASGLI